jgi:protein phosphatase
MQLKVIDETSLTDVGKKRRQNEDAIGAVHLLANLIGNRADLAKKGCLYAVADGMGGHVGGEIASNLAVQALFLSYYRLDNDPLSDFKKAVAEANLAVFQAGNGKPTASAVAGEVAELSQQINPQNNSEEADHSHMGTTLVAALVLGNTLYICNVGDSRIYLLREGKLIQLTRDHSFVGEGLRQGILTKEQARTSPFNNIITRALGLHPQVEADFTEVSLQNQDTFLLCSDGLYRAVDETAIEQALAKMTPSGAAHYLINAANSAGGPDNISVVIVKVGRV